MTTKTKQLSVDFVEVYGEMTALRAELLNEARTAHDLRNARSLRGKAGNCKRMLKSWRTFLGNEGFDVSGLEVPA